MKKGRTAHSAVGEVCGLQRQCKIGQDSETIGVDLTRCTVKIKEINKKSQSGNGTRRINSTGERALYLNRVVANGKLIQENISVCTFPSTYFKLSLDLTRTTPARRARCDTRILPMPRTVRHSHFQLVNTHLHIHIVIFVSPAPTLSCPPLVPLLF